MAGRPSRKKRSRGGKQRPWRIILAVLGVAFVGFVAMATWVILRVRENLPDLANLAVYKPKLVTRIYASNGKLIGELAKERRTIAPMEKIPKSLIYAVVSAEDARFFEHSGISYFGILRAFFSNLRHGRVKQGGSTITQQMVKTLLLSPERTIARKLAELYLAHKVEKTFSKDQILWLYLNQINFGHGRYGCQEAARFYFHKEIDEINVGEAALLAGLPQQPTRLEPIGHPDAAKRRQRYVLDQMSQNGHITAEVAEKWKEAPLGVVAREDEGQLAPETVDIVKQSLLEKFGSDKVFELGIDVKTTIDTELQIASRKALEQGLEALDERGDYRGPFLNLKGKTLTRHLESLAKAMPGGEPKIGAIYDAVVTGVKDDTKEVMVDLGAKKGILPTGPGLDRRYNPKDLRPSERFRPGDIIRVRPTGERRSKANPAATDGDEVVDHKDDAYVVAPEFGPQGAVVVMDPTTHEIRALVGGYAFAPGNFNRAVRAKRQPGSSFKPILYATAFATRKYTAASIVNDAPEVYDLWKPKNDEKEVFAGPVRLRTALARSINTVAIRLISDVTPQTVVSTAQQLGIASELQPDLSLALGSSSVSVLEMANAYATLADQGRYRPPVLIKEVGDEITQPPATTQAIAPDVAFLITQVMTSVVTEGTGRQAMQLRREIAGKTGTTNAHRDAWFIGYTPDLVAAVWVGFDDGKDLGQGEQGARAALPIWISLMKTALKTRPPRAFAQPPGIVVVRIDPKTGMLPAPGASDAIDEYFLEGTEPTAAAKPEQTTGEDLLLDQAE